MDGQICLRGMLWQDTITLPQDFAAQGWNKTQEKYVQYYQEQQAGLRTICVAAVDGRAAGYATLVPQAAEGPFAGLGIPEIQDFNVLQRHQRQGLGNRILDVLEREAARSCDRVSLAVGMHSGYGQAQRMYVKRGYLPDGSGVWYRGTPLAPYTLCCNDDDLLLYFSKPVR